MPKLMKLVGRIREEVIVMIDTGTTNNFIALLTVNKLGIHIANNKIFALSLGNGVVLQGTR